MSQEQTQSYDVSAGTRIVVESTSGKVKLIGADQASATFVGDYATAVFNESKNELHIRTGRGGSQRLKVYVPHTVDVLVRSASGDIRLRELNGDIVVRSMSGDVTASALQGDVHLQTVSGDAYIARSCLGTLDAHTVSGDIIVETPLDHEGDYSMTSVSGSVRLRLPEDQAATVRFTTLSGDFSCSLPYDGKDARRNTEALVNGGGVPVRIHTTSGDARIEAVKDILEEDTPEPMSESMPDPQSWVTPEPVPQASHGAETKPLDSTTLGAVSESAPRFDPDSVTAPSPQPFGLDEGSEAPFAADEEAPVADRAMSEEPEAVMRMKILRAIEEGRMTVSEGLARLRELE